MSWLDLHMHSVESMDGEYPPEQVVLIAYEAGVKVMAISDHNITTAVKPGMAKAKELGIICIPGVELDVQLEGRNFHMLGYGIDPEQKDLCEFGNKVRHNKIRMGQSRMEMIHKMGIFFDDQEVLKICKQGHVIIADIMEVALNDHRNNGNPILEKYRKSAMPGVDFYWDYCAKPESPGYIAEGNLSAEEGIRCIKAAGGIPILAHPGANMGKNEEMFGKLVEVGIEGVEAFCSYHQKKEDVFYQELAKKHGVIVTQGSDFHGKLKPQIKAGSIESGLEDEIYKNLCKKLGW